MSTHNTGVKIMIFTCHQIPPLSALLHNTKTCPCNIHRFFSTVKIENFHGNIFSSPEPLGSQGELIGWP